MNGINPRGEKHAGRDLEKERLWRARLHEQRASGLSIRAYCRREGFGEALFHWWKGEIARRGEGARMPAARAVFAEVRVEPAALAGPQAEGAIEVVLLGGRRLRVWRGFDGATLVELARALEEAAPC